jgi:lipooligosaccharide transport system permease protein
MTLATRILPPGAIGGRRALLLVERNVRIYRRTWLVLVSGLFEPLFYLLGIGFGLGGLVGQLPGPNGPPISYQAFVAPGLLSAAAMNGAIFEATFNFFFKLRYAKTYDSILSTPLGVADVALGEVTWALLRGTLYAIGFMIVALVLGLVLSPTAILAVPVALLIGFAFGAVGMAATSFMRNFQDFDLVQLILLPMFLLSGTFYPISTYPPLLQFIVELTPLYHGVALERAVMLGAVGPGNLIDAAYLLVMGLLGLLILARRLDRLLLR